MSPCPCIQLAGAPKGSFNIILSPHLPEPGGCHPKQPSQLLPRGTGWERGSPWARAGVERQGRGASGHGGSHCNVSASLERHLPSSSMTRTGKPHSLASVHPSPLEGFKPSLVGHQIKAFPLQRSISIQGCPLVIALLQADGCPTPGTRAGRAQHPAHSGTGWDRTGGDRTGQLLPARLKHINWATPSP